MSLTKCPECGGSELYRSDRETPANGFSVRLLPNLPWGRVRVVVCKDCGLTRFFASHVDLQALSGSSWERVNADAPSQPLGLNTPTRRP